MSMLSWHGLTFLSSAPTKRSSSLLVLMLSTPTGSTFSSPLRRPKCGSHTSLNRQTVFYTPTTLTMSKGQTITGHLTCAPNTRNNRDLDIVITHKTNEDDETRIQYKMCVPSPSYLLCAFFSFFCCAAASMRRRWESHANRVLGLDSTLPILSPFPLPHSFHRVLLIAMCLPSRQVLIGALLFRPAWRRPFHPHL